MRLEFIPLIFGGLIGSIGLGLVVDAWTPDRARLSRGERRRSARIERSRRGEALIGLGMMSVAAALLGRDTWRYSVLAVIAGSIFLLFGVLSSRRFLGASITRRGALRRRTAAESRSSEASKRP